MIYYIFSTQWQLSKKKFSPMSILICHVNMIRTRVLNMIHYILFKHFAALQETRPYINGFPLGCFWDHSAHTVCAVITIAYRKETLRNINNQGACRLKNSPTPELVLTTVAINFSSVFLLVCVLHCR